VADPLDDIRDRLARHPWGDTLPLLVEYARKRVGWRTWGGARGGRLPAGREAEDVVYEAIEKVYGGQRVWDPAAKPDLVQYLKDVIESDVHHLATGFENRGVLTESALGERLVDGEPEPFLQAQPAAGPSPAEAAERGETDREAKAFAEAFLATLGDEPGMATVVQCIFDGLVKPAEIAGRTGMAADDIYNMRKRLQRRLLDFYADWGPKHGTEPRGW